MGAWIAWRFHRTPISGDGWLGTPIDLLVTCSTLNIVYDTWTEYRKKDSKWGLFTAYQRGLIHWLEQEIAKESYG